MDTYYIRLREKTSYDKLKDSRKDPDGTKLSNSNPLILERNWTRITDDLTHNVFHVMSPLIFVLKRINLNIFAVIGDNVLSWLINPLSSLTRFLIDKYRMIAKKWTLPQRTISEDMRSIVFVISRRKVYEWLETYLTALEQTSLVINFDIILIERIESLISSLVKRMKTSLNSIGSSCLYESFVLNKNIASL